MKSRMPPLKNPPKRRVQLDPMLTEGTLDFGMNETSQRSNYRARQ